MKIKVTPQQHANACKLLEILENTPEKKVYLSSYTKRTECGTLHCSLGWAAVDPYFKAQGLHLANGRYPQLDIDIQPPVRYHGLVSILRTADPDDISSQLFGDPGGDSHYEPTAWNYLFAPARSGVWDGELDPNRNFTDKALAVARLQEWISILEVDND